MKDISIIISARSITLIGTSGQPLTREPLSEHPDRQAAAELLLAWGRGWRTPEQEARDDIIASLLERGVVEIADYVPDYSPLTDYKPGEHAKTPDGSIIRIEQAHTSERVLAEPSLDDPRFSRVPLRTGLRIRNDDMAPEERPCIVDEDMRAEERPELREKEQPEPITPATKMEERE